MKYLIPLLLLALLSCKGSLTDEQRKKIRENMDQGEIKKVTDSEITEAAYDYGREISSIVQSVDKLLLNSSKIDSLAKIYNVELITLSQDKLQNLRPMERQVLDAYLSGGGLTDNIQKLGTDSLLYTKPILREHPDGSTEFLKALGIRMTRKQIVLSIKD
jgi:hypothetical protein